MKWGLLFLGVLSLVFALVVRSWTPPDTQEGTFHLVGLQQPVTVDWDPHHIPWVKAQSWQDAYFLQGYLSARDRFFQMDLTRRKLAGRLSEVFGERALPSDIQYRSWNFSKAAELAVSAMSPENRARFEAYAQGVNQFLALKQKPWEMKLLRAPLIPWRPEDCLLVVLSMYDHLNRHQSSHEEALALLKQKLAPRTLSFFLVDWGFLDAPIVPDPFPLSDPPLPLPKDFTVQPGFRLQPPQNGPDDFEPGSNAWAISGRLTQSGLPILAGDPHLDLRVPNLWYRMGISIPKHSVFGVSIPGIPGIVIGRNDHLAWTFTNASVDNADQILLPPHATEISSRTETIQIQGQPDHQFNAFDSPWGPVISHEGDRPVAIQWTALDPQNLKTLDLSQLNSAANTQELLKAFRSWGGPPQNAIFATRSGDIGWTLVGKIPKRIGFDGQSRQTRTPDQKWLGYLTESQFPVRINPPEGFVVSANQRTVPISTPFLPFGSHWPNPARARRITDLLVAGSQWSASQSFQVQLDNLSLTHLKYRDFWAHCPQTNIEASKAHWFSKIEPLLRQWHGRTDLNSTAYPILKTFRIRLQQQLLTPMAMTLDANKSSLLVDFLMNDAFISRVLKHQPPHFLPPEYSSYCDLIQTAMLEAAQSLANSPEKLLEVSWGQINKSEINHPLSRVFPKWLSSWINFPTLPLPGDSLVPNVMTPMNGASMRMIIDLADSKNSLFSQPGGQTANPWSPHYSEFFRFWVDGHPVPFEAQTKTTTEFFNPEKRGPTSH